MANAPITIKDIALALGVSVSTVSRALKNNPDISKETRQLVNDYARTHNYKPNVMAANLRSSRSTVIGVIVPQLVHHFFSCVLSGIEQKASAAGYTILVAQSREKYDEEVTIVRRFQEARVCGVIASLAKETSCYDHYQDLIDAGIPVVFYDRICTGVKTERVVVDDYAGAFAAVEYLIQTGCKRICFMGAAPHLEITKNRKNGYLDALHRYTIPVDEQLIITCDSQQKALAITPDILERPNRPDAFFAINDETAAGVLHACKMAGIRVPEEVSICGFSDGMIAQSTDPQLTTVEQHGEEVGSSAFTILQEKIERQEGAKEGCGTLTKNRIVRTNLVVRGTTK